MNLSGKDDDMNCCSNKKETPQKCCTDNAAEALVSINKNSAANNPSSSSANILTAGTTSKATREKDASTTNNNKPSITSKDHEKKSNNGLVVVCPNKRRQRTVSVDFSNPCNCCPAEESDTSPAPKKAKTTAPRNSTLVDDLAALAQFLKQEREIWMTTDVGSSSSSTFFEPSPQDTALVAEWRTSGRSVHAKLQEQARRLKDMEAKFGAWETHHFT